MKNIQRILLAVATFATVAIVSCKKEEDPCANVTCMNGGTCNDGTCACAAGYEGSNCGTEQRAKFFGTYNVNETCTSGNYTYTTTIATSATGVTTVIFDNFGGFGVAATGTVSGTTITAPNQTITDSAGNSGQVSGSGQISGNILTLTYTLAVTGGSDSCTATMTKQ